MTGRSKETALEEAISTIEAQLEAKDNAVIIMLTFKNTTKRIMEAIEGTPPS